MLIRWAGLRPSLPPQIIRIYKPKDEGEFRRHAVFMRTFSHSLLISFLFFDALPVYLHSLSKFQFIEMNCHDTFMRRAKEIPQLENKRGNQFAHSVNNNLYGKCNKDRKKMKRNKKDSNAGAIYVFICKNDFKKKWKELNLAASPAHSFHSHTICFPAAWINEVEFFFF